MLLRFKSDKTTYLNFLICIINDFNFKMYIIIVVEIRLIISKDTINNNN